MRVLDFLFGLGTKSGMPRYVAFIGLLQTGILFVPEEAWTILGINALQDMQRLPTFVQYYVVSSSFKSSMLVFWCMSPFAFLCCTYLLFVHINFRGYPAYLQRRQARLNRRGITSDYSLAFGALATIAIYVWGTGIYLAEPVILGDFVPAKSRIAMVIIHAGAISLVLPVMLTMLVTELRANISGHLRSTR